MNRPPPEPLSGDSENPLVGWAKAIALGIRDTAREMLDEGRRGASAAYDEGWDRFDEKVKNRRKRPK